MDFSQEEVTRHLHRIARGTVVTLAGAIVLQPAGLVFAIVLVRVLGEKGFGVLSLGMSLLVVASLSVSLGLPQAIIRFVPRSAARGNEDEGTAVAVRALALIVLAGTLAAVALTFAVQAVSVGVFHKPQLAAVLSVLAWAIPIEALRLGLAAATVSRHTTAYEAGSNVTRIVVGLVLAAAFAGPLGLGLRGAALGVLAGCGAGAAVALVGVARVFPALLRRPWRALRTGVPMKELFGFALPMVLTRLAQIGLYEINTVLAGYWLTNVQVGIYAAASRLAKFGTVGLVAVGSILRPSISSLHTQKRVRELDEVFVIATRWVYMITMPLLVFIAMRSRQLLGLFGPSFPDGTVALVALCIGQMVNVSTGNVGHMLAMSGRQMLQLADNVAVMVLNVALCVLMIPRFGLLGAAAGGAMAMAAVNLLRAAQVWWLYRITAYRWRVVKVAVAAAVAAPVLIVHFGRGPVELVWAFAVYLVAYSAALAAFRLAPEDRYLFQAALSPRRFGRVSAERKGNEPPPRAETAEDGDHTTERD